MIVIERSELLFVLTLHLVAPLIHLFKLRLQVFVVLHVRLQLLFQFFDALQVGSAESGSDGGVGHTGSSLLGGIDATLSQDVLQGSMLDRKSIGLEHVPLHPLFELGLLSGERLVLLHVCLKLLPDGQSFSASLFLISFETSNTLFSTSQLLRSSVSRGLILSDHCIRSLHLLLKDIDAFLMCARYINTTLGSLAEAC